MEKQDGNSLRPLLVAQFFGAFNDNAWKLIVALLGIRALSGALDGASGSHEAAIQEKTTLALVVFTLPLMLFSLPAAQLADRWSKRTIIVSMKACELALMGIAALALAFAPPGSWLFLAILGLMGVQSALFSPAKYGILPEILPHEKLSEGNGRLEMWTFIAIIAGTAAAGTFLEWSGETIWLAGLILAFFAAVGLAASFWVPRVPAASGGRSFGETLGGAWRAIRGERVLYLTILGLAYYWFVASLLSQDLFVYTKSVLGQSERNAGLVLASCGLGVGLGAVLAGRFSHSKVEYGLIPFGALSLCFFLGILALLTPERVAPEEADARYWEMVVLVFPLGVASGFLLVPLDALLQWRAPPERRGAVIALSNVLVFAGVLAGSLLAQTLSAPGPFGLWETGLSSRGILLGAVLITAGGTIWAVRLLPDSLLRFVLVVATHSIYRLRVSGRENVPKKGGALLVPNHVSFIDGLLLLATVDRPIRFIVDSTYFHHRLLKPFMRSLRAIPISAAGGPRVVLRALREAGECIERGELVCIFAEGQITRTGMLLPFRRGLERITKGRTTTIIPVNLEGVWGSIFSWFGGRFVMKMPRKIPYPVAVTFGEPLPPGTPIPEIRRHVHELGVTAWTQRKVDRRPLHHSFARAARRHPLSFGCADQSRARVRRFSMLIGTIALARALRRHWHDQENVGVCLPSSVGGALANLAAAFLGRASVNLNFTAGQESMESAARQAGLRTVLTSRAFLEKTKLELPSGLRRIWIEDVKERIDWKARLLAFLIASLVPYRFIERFCGSGRRVDLDDVVTIIFSSGSTGEPKGVLLTHFNVASNVDAISRVMRVRLSDRLLGTLPLFHSFGYLALWFSANYRLGCVFHPNPLDAAAIGHLVQRYRITLMIATPTFLQIYMRRCTPAQFGSLRMILTGAEKLPERMALEFEDIFGIRPLEGYGTTECSPGVAVSTPDYRAPGFYQPGSRRGSVGQPLPGVAVRIVDPEKEFDPRTSEAFPPGRSGMLVVKGPNVMKGYLGRDDLTAKVLKDGWYVTGDIAAIDEDGFLRITGRLSRFSKIGGEMVPHGRIEEALHEAAGVEDQVFAVTAVPDEKKGERLAVLHTLEDDERKIREIVEKLARMGLPNLFIPRPESFIHVEKIPLLGTGKLDLREVQRQAMEALVSTG